MFTLFDKVILRYLSPDKECHADACALFIGGNNLANVNSRVVEEWMRQNKSINKNFVHVIKKKKEDYGFLHFESIEDRDVFFNEYQGKKFLVNDENNVTLNFLPVKRSDSYNNNRSVISDSSGRGAYYNLYDNGTYFTIFISLLISDKTKLDLYTDDDDFLFINGEYKEINFSGEVIKKFIPQGKFELKILLPSKIDSNCKVKVEQMEESNLYKIELKKSDLNKRRKLLFE
ncbi:unnamed protein product [Rhizophagus irregularis]|nr:unnamed protein product [Rhizophagus irregularis]